MGFRDKALICLICVLPLLLASAGWAVDGVREINQACAADDPAAGCFPGDDPGFPVTISNRGSYRLTGDLTGVSGENGIVISSDEVTLDLNGFAVVGVSGSLSGIKSTTRNVSILNGTIRNWSQSGVDGAAIRNGRLTNLVASNNGAQGIYGGFNQVIAGCAALENGDYGIVARWGSLITGSTARGNVAGGVGIDDGAAIGNVSTCNGTGIIAHDSLLEHNSLIGNTDDFGGSGNTATLNHTSSETAGCSQ